MLQYLILFRAELAVEVSLLLELSQGGLPVRWSELQQYCSCCTYRCMIDQQETIITRLYHCMYTPRPSATFFLTMPAAKIHKGVWGL